jgi:DNA-binding XRE family transcriptional regulator
MPLIWGYPTVTNNGQVTHVMVPIAEFEKMKGSAGAAPSSSDIDEAVRTLNDATESWHDADAVLASLLRDGLASVRKAHGLTQQELARALDLSQPQVSRLEKSLDGATVRMLRRLATMFVGKPAQSGHE